MNLQLAQKIIGEAEAQPLGFLKVRGPELAREVKQMADAGLIVAADSRNLGPNEAVISKVTHAGRQFYHTFKNLRTFPHH